MTAHAEARARAHGPPPVGAAATRVRRPAPLLADPRAPDCALGGRGDRTGLLRAESQRIRLIFAGLTRYSLMSTMESSGRDTAGFEGSIRASIPRQGSPLESDRHLVISPHRSPAKG
jgi:hypothetical protein